MSELPPPRFAAPPYGPVGLALLHAATPYGLAPSYNLRRGELWAQLQSRRTVPEPAAFMEAMEELRDLLRECGCPRGVMLPDPVGRATIKAARALDRVDELAAGLSLNG